MGLLIVGVCGISDDFACVWFWDPFPPIESPCLVLVWEFVPGLIVICCDMFGWYPWDTPPLCLKQRSRCRANCNQDEKDVKNKNLKILLKYIFNLFFYCVLSLFKVSLHLRKSWINQPYYALDCLYNQLFQPKLIHGFNLLFPDED